MDRELCGKTAHIHGEGAIEDEPGALGARVETPCLGGRPYERARWDEDASSVIDEALEELAMRAALDAPTHRRIRDDERDAHLGDGFVRERVGGGEGRAVDAGGGEVRTSRSD